MRINYTKYNYCLDCEMRKPKTMEYCDKCKRLLRRTPRKMKYKEHLLVRF